MLYAKVNGAHVVNVHRGNGLKNINRINVSTKKNNFLYLDIKLKRNGKETLIL